MGDIDYKYSLAFLLKLNMLSRDNMSIANSFFYEGYNLWHINQQLIFEDIKAFSVSKKFSPRKKTAFFSKAKDFVIGALLALFSLASFLFLVIRKRTVLVYSIDRTNSAHQSDFRLAPLYEVLVKRGVRYFELFHTVPRLQTFQNILMRKRGALYLEAIGWVFHWKKILGFVRTPTASSVELKDLSDFDTQDEKLFAKEIVRRYRETTSLSIYKINILRRLLRHTSIKAFFAIDDMRYYQEILLACKSLGIQTYALQHGHFTKYHVGWLQREEFEGNFIYPDALLVRSEYWKQELLHLGTYFPRENIQIAGVQVLPKKDLGRPGRKGEENSKSITILIPYETSCPKSEVAEYIRIFLSLPDVSVVFKLRPDIQKEIQLAEYGLLENMPGNWSTVSDIKEIEQDITFVAGTYSTYLYDMIALGKHILVLDTSTDYGERMVENGIADRIGRENIPEALKRLSRTGEEELGRRRDTLIGNPPKSLSRTLEEIFTRHNNFSYHVEEIQG